MAFGCISLVSGSQHDRHGDQCAERVLAGDERGAGGCLFHRPASFSLQRVALALPLRKGAGWRCERVQAILQGAQEVTSQSYLFVQMFLYM